MKSVCSWSFAPYRPPFFDAGEIYICRVAPGKNDIFFAWLGVPGRPYRVFVRTRDAENDFALAGETDLCEHTLRGLAENTDYEFFVESGDAKSRIRIARTGAVFGTVVNYLHPDDEAYAFSGRYLCSPSLLRLPDGGLLASMDVYGGGAPQNLTLIYRSDDDGATWQYQCELFPAFWTKLFIHNGEVYALACSTEYGDLLIGKSTDGGKTFGLPTVLLRGSNGKGGWTGVHKNPQPVVTFGGRIWNTLEWGSWGMGFHAAMVMSAPEGADLLNAANWLFSEPLPYTPKAWGLPEFPTIGCLEGALAVKDGVLYNIMRFHMESFKPKNYGLVLAYRVDTDHPEAPLTFDKTIEFPANHSKFSIQYHERRKCYYSIATRITAPEHAGHRNLLSLMKSDDLEHWEVVTDIQNRLADDPAKVGMQYVDFFIEGDKILFLTRLADNNAHSYHDSNYSVFASLELP